MDKQTIFFCDLIKNVIHGNEQCQQDAEVNWTCLVQLAKEQNLLPIFVEGASKYPSYTARPEYMVELQETLAVVAAQVKRTEAFLKLYQSLAQVGIYPLVMKGLVCRGLYGNLSDHRPSGDEDILIRPEEYWCAKEVLMANGYEPILEEDTETKLEDIQEVSFIHPQERLHIELHLNAIGKEDDDRVRMNARFQNVFEHGREFEVRGVTIRTMSHDEHLLFLILHAFKHFTSSGLGVRQLLDILLYQKQYGAEIDFEKLSQILKDLKALAFWSDMIHVGNLYFGFDLQAPLKAQCPNDLLDNMMESGTFGSRNEAERIAANTMRNARKGETAGKDVPSLILIWKAIFPNKEYMLIHAPYLEEKPHLLPLAWMKRWGRFLKKSKRHEGNLAIDSVKTSRRRMKMLKKYDLI